MNTEVEKRIAKLERERERETVYRPANELEIPIEVKERFEDDGFGLRWVRFLLQGKEDVTNVGRYLREGYSFVEKEEVPEMLDTCLLERVRRNEEAVTVGDLVLMKAPLKIKEQRQRYYEKLAEDQNEAVNSRLRQLNIRDNSTQKTTRGGRQRNFASES